MGQHRLKLSRGLKDFVPVSVNFSSIDSETNEELADFEPSDGGLEQKRLLDSIEYEEMVALILYHLEPREKLIFTFQLLRDSGYKIDHGSFAKIIRLSRPQYMKILKEVRMKAYLYMIGYQSAHE